MKIETEIVKELASIEKNIFECTVCNKKYKNSKTMAKHKTLHEKDDLKDLDNNIRLHCNTCGQKFRFHKSLLKHEARHLGEGGFWCRACGQCFNSAEAKDKHREEQHKALKCRICGTVFSSESEYLHHINELHNGRDREMHMCSECGKQFKTKGELTHHISSKCGTIKQYICKICNQTLMTPGSLHNHMLRHNGALSFMCRYCAKMFLTAGQLTVHERIHTQEKAFVCEICGKGFCHRQSLITHHTIHTGIKPYQCEGCGNAFSCVGNLLKHRKTHADSCGVVPLTTHRVKHPATRMKVQANTPANSKLKTIEKQKTIREKIALVNNNKEGEIINEESTINENTINPVNNQISNEELNKNDFIIKLEENGQERSTFDYEKHDDNLINHFNLKIEVTEEISQSIKAEQEDNKIITNDQSSDEDKDFTDDNTNSDDLFTNYDEANTVDDDDIDLYTRVKRLTGVDNNTKQSVKKRRKRERISTKHKNNSKFNQQKLKMLLEDRGFKEGETMKCKYCQRVYTNVIWLLRHESEHANELNEKEEFNALLMHSLKQFQIQCSCCKMKFDSKDECVAHQRSEHSDVLTCIHCARIFANKDSLRTHERVYHKGVPRKVYLYICKKCGKQFKQKAFLIGHEESNCGTGPLYPCSICGKQFSSFHVRKSHMRVHQPEKKLLCRYCAKSFHWKGQLKIHERSHTGEKPFKCSECPKSFAYRESLITHNSMHTGIKTHLCENCGSRFSCIGNLLKHKRTHASTCGMNSTVVKDDKITKKNFVGFKQNEEDYETRKHDLYSECNLQK